MSEQVPAFYFFRLDFWSLGCFFGMISLFVLSGAGFSTKRTFEGGEMSEWTGSRHGITISIAYIAFLASLPLLL